MKKTKQLLSDIHKGKIPWNKGKKDIYSEETLKKMSEKKKGVNLSEEHKQKIKDNYKGFAGYSHTEETKEYLRKINTGRKMSDDIRKKMSDKRKGKKHSEETIRKMSDARKLYWANKKEVMKK